MPSETIRIERQGLTTVRNFLVSEETYATVLLTILIDHYGLEKQSEDETTFVEWHPETLKDEIEKDFGVELPQLNFDKIMAGILVLTTNMFFKNVQAFIHICNVFSGSELTPYEFDPADPLECAWGMSEVLLLTPPDDDDPEPFSDEVRAYIGKALEEYGFITAPDILGIALDADWTDQVTYNFSDDPEMFSAIYKTQDDKTQEVNATIQENLIELLGQLRSLPIRNGTVEGLGEQIFNQLKETASG